MSTSTTRARRAANALPPPHRGALCGRADLLRALAAGRLEATADILGYEPVLPPEPAPPEPSPAIESLPPPPSAPASDRDLPLAPSMFWKLDANVWVEAERDRSAEKSFKENEQSLEDVVSRRIPFPDSPPDPQPVGSFAQLIPTLRGVAAEDRAGRAPDMPAILRKVVKAEMPSRLPIRKRRRWGRSLTVVVDRSTRLIPYRRDFDRVCSGLERLYPEGSVEYERWNGPNAMHPPPEGRVVVALTDLGLLSRGGDAAAAAWGRYGRNLARAGCRPLAIVPVSPRRDRDIVPPWWSIVAWRGAGDDSDDPEDDRRRFEELKALLSPAAQIEPGLVRAMRRLVEGAGPEMEARLYQSSYLASAHAIAATSAPDARAEAFKAFTAMPAERRRLAIDTLRAWRGGSEWAWRTEIMGLDEHTKSLLPEGDLAEASKAFLDMCNDMQDRSNPVGALTWFSRQMNERWRPVIDAEPGTRRAAGEDQWRDTWRRAWVRGWAATFDPSEPRPPGFDLSLLPRSNEPLRRYALRQDDQEILIVREEAASSAPGVPLATIEARRNDFEFEVYCDFWAAGAPPAWADAWGCDKVGPWAEFAVPDARGEAVAQRLRWIPPGTFMMGSPDDEPERRPNEGPRHEVTLARGFWMFDTACRQALWRAAMGENPSHFEGDDRPLEAVSWNDAMAFVERANALKPGLDLALPSEAQWEYACRAGADGPFSFGDTIDPSQVNYDGDFPYAGAAKGLDRGETVPVGSLPANGLGLHEMHGNVWEWCSDVYHPNYRDAPRDGSARLDGDDEPGAKRVLRGGSWLNVAGYCRSAARRWFDPDVRFDFIGFRPLARVQARGGAEPGGSRRIRPAERRIAASLSGGARPGRLVAGGPEARHDLPAGSPFVIRSDCEHLTFGLINRPDWATAIGRDKHGLWTRFEVKNERGGTVSQRMRWIPPGRFTMGSPSDEPGRLEDEGPAHQVTIASGFWCFDTPTTQAMWQAVMIKNPSEFKSPDRPVDSVGWNDCKAFLEKINGQPGVPQLALPTEAEWEYACRAGTRTALYNGPIDILGERNAPALDPIAWYGGNSGHGFDLKKGYNSKGWPEKQYDHSKAGSRAVAQRAANDWGLYDMLGNVWEWVADERHPNYEGAPSDGSAWLDGEIGAKRVLRGGSWNCDARCCRSAARIWGVPDDRSIFIGFRPLARVQA